MGKLASMIGAGMFTAAGYAYAMKNQTAEAWLFRDDIGAPNGIKGYEEQVNSVGLHHGHCYWPFDVTFQTYNSAT
jgi:hypothetical protein